MIQPNELRNGAHFEKMLMGDLSAKDAPTLDQEYGSLLRGQAVGGEQALLVDVLQRHLGRMITSDDFKDCQMKFIAGRPDMYIVAHQGVDLGIVKRETTLDQTLDDLTRNVYSIQHIVTFHPVKVTN